ncbi:MAG TPA: ABC transporter permease [Acidobacteriaceae bacterium]|nr:ABC transporter permease [Acidobacteriaceae bacterium]
MEWLLRIVRKIHLLAGREQFSRDLEDEMAFHRDQTERDLVADGLSPREARQAAARRFGNAAQLGDRSREAWGWQPIEHLLQDVSFGLRTMLRRSPMLTLVAVLSLALGIGANTAIFSLLDAILLRNLPVAAPQQLVLFGRGLWVGSTDGMPNRSWQLFSYPWYREFAQRTDVFSGVAAINSIEFGTHGSFDSGARQLVRADLVSGSFFNVLGVRATLGRALDENDDRAPGSGPVAVASYAWWTRQGRDPAVIGKSLRVENSTYTIVGVAQPGFFGVTVGQSPDFWIPLSMEKEISPGWNGLEDRDFQSLYLIARLKPGVSAAQASASTNTLFRQIVRSQYLGANPTAKELEALHRAQIELTPGARGLSQLRLEMSLPLEILMTVVGLVLLIACANIANLLLARGAARAREIAVRMALGASRSRLVAQLLTESALLAIAGAVIGVALAWKAGDLFLHLASGQSGPLPIDATPDLRVLLFTLVITLGTALLFGLAPALRATRPSLAPSLKEGRGVASASARNLLGRGLIVAQIALSLVLLAGAGLFLRSLMKLSSVDTGFDARNVLTFFLDEYGAGLPQDARLNQLQQTIEDRVQALPGVRAASFSMFTFDQGEWSDSLLMQGIPRTTENSQDVLYNAVGTQFFETFGIPLVAGRVFSAHDREHAPAVAIVNETLARRFFPNGSALGHRFGLGNDPAHATDFEIVGVVKDAKYVSLSERPHMAAYFPWQQRVQYFSNFNVRYSGDSAAVIAAVRKAITQVNPGVIVSNVASLGEQVDASIGNQQLIAQLSALFSLLATFLVCIGLYGLMSYAVARRTSEIGVRMALGAGRGTVQWMVMREILTLAALGLIIGVPVAMLGLNLVAKLEDPHLMSRILFGVGPNDPLALAAAGALMLAVSALAGYIPARRASRIDPMVALRDE